MRRPDRAEVALVERGDLGLIQPFRQCHDAGVDHPERQVRVPRLGVTTPGEIGARGGFDAMAMGSVVTSAALRPSVERATPTRGRD